MTGAYEAEVMTLVLQSPEQEACTKLEDDLANIWNIAAQSFVHHVKCLLKFIKKVPGTRDGIRNEQTNVVMLI